MQVFAYGSLMNFATHSHTLLGAATLLGWRRVWRRSVLRPYAFLSVEPCSEPAGIKGVVLQISIPARAGLDQREGAYQQLEIDQELCPSHGPTTLYQLAPSTSEPPSEAHPILMSYVETVAAGYLAHYGPAGLIHFVDSTYGWQGPIQDDRAAPLYQRASLLPAPTQTELMAMLRDKGACLLGA